MPYVVKCILAEMQAHTLTFLNVPLCWDNYGKCINREDMKCHNILDSDLLSDISQFLHMLTLITAGKY